MPRTSLFIPPCEPILRPRPPRGEAWLHEVKFDGYRMGIAKLGPKVQLFSRNGNDWTGRLPHLAAALTSLTCGSAVIDAELVAPSKDGVADFAALHTLMSRRRDDGQIAWAFDLMMVDDQDLRDLAYVERKARLAELVQRSRIGRLYHSEAFTDGEKLLAECARRGLEGIVSKRRDSLYRSGKSSAWIKVKCAAWRQANRDRHELFERARSNTGG